MFLSLIGRFSNALEGISRTVKIPASRELIVQKEKVGMAVSCHPAEEGVSFRAVRKQGNLSITLGPSNTSVEGMFTSCSSLSG